MKQAVLLALLFTSFFCGSAQNNAADTLQRYTLSPEQKSAWDSIEVSWTRKYFNTFLKRNNIKINCGACTGIYMDVVLTINKEGYANADITKHVRCGGRLSEKQITYFKNSFSQLLFPPSMRNVILNVQVGRYLKC